MTNKPGQPDIISPGSTIGILGSGQLGRMMAVSAKQMGYRVHIFSTSLDSPAGQVADLEFQAELEDLEAMEDFARDVDVLTVETENIPTRSFNVASKFAPSFPGSRTLEVCQNRGLEKQFLADNDIPTPQFRVVHSLEELRESCQQLFPGVLKTTTGGYDGKGQFVIRSQEDIDKAWDALKADEAILEEWIEYDFEFSIVGVRSSAGAVSAYKSIRNEHENGILDISVSPSGLPEEVNDVATKLTYTIMERLDSVGVLTVEFFYRAGQVLVNEIAPRPHNSGHLTIEGHATSQFEQHVRAVCGLTLGSTHQLKPVAMANLLGDEWSQGEPRWHQALWLPNTKLHLYGKAEPKPGRKMGHLTTFANRPEQAHEQVAATRNLLSMKKPAAFEQVNRTKDQQELTGTNV